MIVFFIVTTVRISMPTRLFLKDLRLISKLYLWNLIFRSVLLFTFSQIYTALTNWTVNFSEVNKQYSLQNSSQADINIIYQFLYHYITLTNCCLHLLHSGMQSVHCINKLLWKPVTNFTTETKCGMSCILNTHMVSDLCRLPHGWKDKE
jgi:hypothetical protein